MYKFFVYSPDDSEVINKIIVAASEAGAGKIGNYENCAFIIKGHGTWLPIPGAKPVDGEIGQLSIEPEVKIEMECPKEKMEAVFMAIREVHPYEKIAIDAVTIERFE
ncbi:YqfO family protein [soil metagenome]